MAHHGYEEWQEERNAEIEAEKDQYLDDEVWVSSEGVETPVKKLENDHLDNIMKWLKENEFYRGDEWIQVLEEEAERRTRDMFNSFND